MLWKKVLVALSFNDDIFLQNALQWYLFKYNFQFLDMREYTNTTVVSLFFLKIDNNLEKYNEIPGMRVHIVFCWLVGYLL